MAAAKAIAWIIFISMIYYITCRTSEKTQVSASYEYRGICSNMICNNISALMKLRNCTIVLGFLQIALMEKETKEDFVNITFPELREVTGHMIMYRVFGIQTLGKLFPNLSRIRGSELLDNYALIIYDLPDLLEVGLYSLLKVDRGGVIIGGGPLTCYMDTINWEVITNGRHVVFPPEIQSYCNVYPRCSCDDDTIPSFNYCWSNLKCQRFLEGPEAEKCDSQCFGCRNTNASDCSLCRYYTFRGRCLNECPVGTIVLDVNKYCILENECERLGGWSWNNSCVFKCPRNFTKTVTTNGTTCTGCDNCYQTCKSILIQWQSDLQAAKKCVYINGSLTIRMRSVSAEVLREMRHYLSVIREVSDYVLIYGSISLTSLDFLSSLQRINGTHLYKDKYSLVVYRMQNLQTLFISNVTNNLNIANGTVRIYNNPMLCSSQIDELKNVFPVAPSEMDIPPGMNGYSGACDEVSLQLRVKVKNETSAEVIFNRIPDENIQYFILYVRIPKGRHTAVVPETCSELEWNAISVPSTNLNNHIVRYLIPSLQPASSYALCIETYNPIHDSFKGVHLARSSIVKFNTTVGKPEPPFITELVASSFKSAVIRWVDHKDYRLHINHYELDVSVVEINLDNIAARDYCANVIESPQELDYSRHAVVKRPPKNYEEACESMCGVLSRVTVGAVTDEYFDVCSLYSGCDEGNNPPRMRNSTFGKYVKTLMLNISSPETQFEIGNLAPFRDYRFELRACTKRTCSRSMSRVVRTLRLETADVPYVKSVKVIEPEYIEIQWRAPKVTNGPVLAFNVEILPVLPDMEKILPRILCVSSNITNLSVKLDTAEKYIVRVCATTLGSNYICSNGKRITMTYASTWWRIGLPAAFIVYICSLIIGWLVRTEERRSDEISLVDMTSANGIESEPPSQMLSDPIEFYTVSFRDLQLQ